MIWMWMWMWAGRDINDRRNDQDVDTIWGEVREDVEGHQPPKAAQVIYTGPQAPQPPVLRMLRREMAVACVSPRGSKVSGTGSTDCVLCSTVKG